MKLAAAVTVFLFFVSVALCIWSPSPGWTFAGFAAGCGLGVMVTALVNSFAKEFSRTDDL